MAKRVVIGGRAGRPPAWLLGQIEAPAGSKDMGTYTAAVYTEEQQARLGVDQFGAKKVQALGPAWTRGEIEAPAGSKDMGGWTAAVYTEEQQGRLGVDEFGKKRTLVGGPGSVGPAWTRGDIEAPAGEKDMGGWKAAVYTEEQQARLGVDESGQKKVKALGPAWTRGEIEAPAGEKDMGGYKAAVYTEEQQARLGVDETGNKRAPLIGGGAGSIGPAWTRGEIERPAGEKNMGTWTAAVYTEEQQARLGVDESGNKVGHGHVKALGPAWTRGDIEAPAGEKDMGGYKAAVYTAEQQARLGVDETGNKVAQSHVQTLGPAWTRGDIEAPAGEKDMGGWKAAVYTAEQQARLGVDESGKKVEQHAHGLAGCIGPAWTRGEIERPAGTKDMGGWTAAYYTEEQQARLGVDEFGKPLEEQLRDMHIVGGPGSIGPAWTRGEIEAPAGEKDMGGWTAAVYTEEQQGRLGVDEFGFKK